MIHIINYEGTDRVAVKSCSIQTDILSKETALSGHWPVSQMTATLTNHTQSNMVKQPIAIVSAGQLKKKDLYLINVVCHCWHNTFLHYYKKNCKTTVKI